MKKNLFTAIIFSTMFLLLAGCGPAEVATTAETATTAEAAAPRGMGMGNMGGGSMMARHHAPIPAAYADLSNPVPADEASIARGEELYVTLCATCHGDGGMGDGPAAANLEPAPVAIAHTSQMMGDNYLFWRISEGGAADPFNSVMPAWKDGLEEQARWDLINYVRALGQGSIQPRRMMGGEAFDPAAEAARHEAMVEAGVAKELFSVADGETFLRVHAEMDQLTMGGFANNTTGGMNEMQSALLTTLIADGSISAADAEIFQQVHDDLMTAGLME